MASSFKTTLHRLMQPDSIKATLKGLYPDIAPAEADNLATLFTAALNEKTESGRAAAMRKYNQALTPIKERNPAPKEWQSL